MMMEGKTIMTQVAGTVTLWQVWYRDRENKDFPGCRPLRLRLLYAPSQEAAHGAALTWLKEQGLQTKDLERLFPSPYGLQFQTH